VRKFAFPLSLVVCLGLLAGLLALGAGCSQGKPEVIVFIGKSSQSYADVSAMVKKAEKQFGDKVTWKRYDYDAASSAGAKKKYYVSMNPTIIITNAQGQVKQTYMGKPMEDDFFSKIQSFIPSSGKSASTPGSAPGSVTVPGTTVPMTTPPSNQPSIQTEP